MSGRHSRWTWRAVLGSALLLRGCAPRRRPGRELEFWSLEPSQSEGSITYPSTR